MSLIFQVRGLAGPNGILPARDSMEAASGRLRGLAGWFELPTFCWVSSGEGSLLWQCGLGIFFSLLLVAGLVPRISCAALWLLWLSLTVACRDFWDFNGRICSWSQDFWRSFWHRGPEDYGEIGCHRAW